MIGILGQRTENGLNLTLKLDLSESYAKLARARFHLESGKQEIANVSASPYEPRLGIVDAQSGWGTVYLTPAGFPANDLGVIVGDLVHNLRSALDYIVTALVDASGATLRAKHQFPIYVDQIDYLRKVGDASTPRPTGCIAGIKYGMQAFWDAQPFASSDPTSDPLLHVNFFSNADKHRQIIESKPYPSGKSQLNILSDSRVLELIPIDVTEADYKEHTIAKVRFAHPIPKQVRIEYTVNFRVRVDVKPFGKNTPTFSLSPGIMEHMCARVTEILNLFGEL